MISALALVSSLTGRKRVIQMGRTKCYADKFEGRGLVEPLTRKNIQINIITGLVAVYRDVRCLDELKHREAQKRTFAKAINTRRTIGLHIYVFNELFGKGG